MRTDPPADACEAARPARGAHPVQAAQAAQAAQAVQGGPGSDLGHRIPPYRMRRTARRPRRDGRDKDGRTGGRTTRASP